MPNIATPNNNTCDADTLINNDKNDTVCKMEIDTNEKQHSEFTIKL